MTNHNGEKSQGFVVTKGYRRFAEMCDACRRARMVGLGYGPPGTGKTESASYYAQWNHFKPFLPEPLITFTGRSAVDGLYPYRPLTLASAPLDTPIQECRTVFYTPPVTGAPGRIEREVLTLFAAFSYLVEAANQRHQGKEEFLVTRRFSRLIELLVVDEANRLKDAGLEQIRDIADRGEIGLVLLGMPGLEKRVARAPQLYLRIGFAHEMEPLSEEETRFFLDQRWSHRVSAHSDDFTDQEAVAAILRIARGNIRLIERLMMQVEHVLVANQLTVITKEVVETARENLNHWVQLIDDRSCVDQTRMSCLKTVGLLRQFGTRRSGGTRFCESGETGARELSTWSKWPQGREPRLFRLRRFAR